MINNLVITRALSDLDSKDQTTIQSVYTMTSIKNYRIDFLIDSLS